MRRRQPAPASLCVFVAVLAAGTACQRQVSPFSQPPPSTLRAGPPLPSGHAAAPAVAAPAPAAPAPSPVASPAGVPVDTSALAAKIGVELGGFRYGSEVACAAVLRARSGSVAIRRTGELSFAAVGIETRLHPGDQLITGDGARAVLLLADQTVIELGDSSALLIGNPLAAAAPASSAAVLGGVARFSVSPRATGEGAFLTFVGGAVVAADGPGTGAERSTAATFAVGVAGPATARVGVESGQVKVAAPATLKKWVAVGSGEAVEMNGRGEVGRPSPFPDDDWARWRVGADRRRFEAWAEKLGGQRDGADAQRLSALQDDIDRCSERLVQLAARSMQLATELADDQDSTSRAALRRYKQAAPEFGATLEAAFRLSVETERLTTALLAATYGSELLAARRGPGRSATPAADVPAATASILYNKKFQWLAETTAARLRPLYYVHHPVGRKQAAAVGVEVPAFFAQTPLEPLTGDAIDGVLKRDTYTPPAPITADGAPAVAGARTVSLDPPKPDWHAWLVVPPAEARDGTRPTETATPVSLGDSEDDQKFRASLRSTTKERALKGGH